MRIQFEDGERSVLIARCGLGPNATDQEIHAAVTRRLLAGEENPGGQSAADDPAQPTHNPTTSEETGNPGEPSGGRPSPEQRPAEDGGSVGGTPENPRGTDNAPEDDDDGDTVTVDAAAYRELTGRANLAAKIQEDQRQQTRDNLIEAAIREGKFPPSRRDHYRARYDDDPEAVTARIGRMAKNVVPLEARGVEAADEEVDTSTYPAEWVQGHVGSPAPATNGSGRGGVASRIHTED
jgi:hypothetical protein